MPTKSPYSAGTCNIGGRERRARYRYAGLALLAAAGYLAVVLPTELPSIPLVGLFVPFSVGAEWTLQARRSFCARLALAGEYAFDGQAGEVTDAEARRTDGNAAVVFAVADVAVGAVATAVIYLSAPTAGRPRRTVPASG